MTAWSQSLFRAAYHLDTMVDRAYTRWHASRGWRIPLRILPYRGFGRCDEFLVRARVIRDRGVRPASERDGWFDNLQAGIKRFLTFEIKDARVRVRINGDEHEAFSDEEGFVDLWCRPTRPLNSGQMWHRVDFELLTPPSRSGQWRASSYVMTVPPQAEMGVISDIDDTVIRMGARHPLKKARALFLTSAFQRLPFEGVASFYRALQGGGSGQACNPIFFVSSSPWNLYEHLTEFFTLQGIPDAPLFLRDWGISAKGIAPGGGHGHKLEHVELILNTYPSLPFVLVGDSGQQDAELYEKVVRTFPGRIRAVYIRDVTRSTKRAAQLAAVAKRVHAAGSEMLVCRDSAEAAEHAATRDWIQHVAVAHVRAAQLIDQRKRSLLEQAIESHERT